MHATMANNLISNTVNCSRGMGPISGSEGSALVGCRVGADGGAEAAAAAPGRLVLVVASLLEAAVPGLEAPPSGGRVPFTGGVPGLLPAAVPGLEACGGEGALAEHAEPPEIASYSARGVSRSRKTAAYAKCSGM